MKKLFSLLILILLFNCKEDKGTTRELPPLSYTSENARGFDIQTNENYAILSIKNPWPKADKTFRYALIPRENLATITLNKDEFDGIISTPVKKIVVTSTTHIPALELLNVEKTLVGFPGTNYVSSKKTRALIDSGNIRELGKNDGINTEVLLELQPEVVVGFGIDGNNKTFETIKKSGIPILYNGDWVEETPLAKAEWIKFFGVLFNKSQKADSIYNNIKKDYFDAKQLASKVKKSPTVLSGALHKDVWYLPSGTSPEAQLLKDANVNYLWKDVTGEGSLALNFEAVFSKAKQADIWLSPSYYNSLKALKDANEHYIEFSAFKNKHVYSFVNTAGPTGGVTYYEEGTSRPDLVLKDIIKICHPELLPEYKTHFFKPLQ
ncbi:ABC transporter substrate-binding protein [Hanstruepera neustonica]|uniref:ABC transporter substrate-binding protein n=1 Tax=Hanstruepera neustonica TaxID=1445657 RepID=A0A2K1DWU9_9FLAO|nr:ABC transporter substrate-binding protein [Hanstruepera neustonica]PNQ72516.1 ABC transporter substrate-binding protein [Hanstruepera neustonica]